MTSVDQYNLTTVINKEEFQKTVVVKQCPTVGRSLVAKRPLVPGDVVLVEEPLIKYDLRPTCRSNKSPYFSKKLWKSLIDIVKQHEEPVEEQIQELKEEKEEEEKDEDDSYSGYSNEQDSDDDEEEEEEEISTDSNFCPGVPAAILAYLDVHPPTNAYQNVRKRQSFQSDDFDFFYYPNTSEEPFWLDHKTIQLIHTVTHQVVNTQALFTHVDPVDLSSFVLKIYSNAHTVSLPRQRSLPTHTHKKYRRELYKDKFEENDTYWGEDAEELANTPTIALLRWGSKFAHSCSPNLFLRFEPSRNAMVFTVVRPLAEGDVLSFSYLPEDDLTVGGLVCGTTVDRQAKLEKFKFFTCACERCSDWDWSRGVDCKECNQPTNYLKGDGVWTCFSCQKTTEEQPSGGFIGDKEKNVQRMIMGFASRVYGNRRMNQAMMRMLEPYLLNLLEPTKEGDIAVPKHHWTYSVIHSLLATYHLTLFPQSFGKGLASQLGMTQQGLEEALVYVEFLNDTIRTHANMKSNAEQGNPMAAFFAGWRMLIIVIDLVMDATENKYANVTYDSDSDDSSSSDSDSDCSDHEEESDKEEAVEEVEQNEEAPVVVTNEEEESVPVTKEEETTPTEPELIPLPQDWIKPVCNISNIVSKEWVPLINQVFQSHQSVVVQDMLDQIKSFAERVEKTSSLSTTSTQL